MKKSLRFLATPLFAFFVCISAYGQGYVQIGSDSAFISRSVLGAYYGYFRDISLYTGTELGGGGTVTAIAYRSVFNDTTPDVPLKIYLGQSQNTSFVDTTIDGFENGAGMVAPPTVVYDSVRPHLAAGEWVVIPVRPFTLTAGYSLAVLTEVSYGNTGVNDSAYVYLTAGASNRRFVFAHDNTVSTDPGTLSVYRPNIRVYITGTVAVCPAVTFLNAVSQSGTSVQLTYRGTGATNVGYRVVPAAGGAAITGTFIDTVATVSGLQPNTGYYAYAQNTCSAGFSAEYGPVAFTTQCEASASPFFEGFNLADGSSVPCWTATHIAGPTGYAPLVASSTGTLTNPPLGPLEGTGALRFHSYITAATAAIERLESPAITITGTNPIISLNYTQTNNYDTALREGIVVQYAVGSDTAFTDLSDFLQRYDGGADANGTWVQFRQALPANLVGQNIRIGLKFYADNGDNIFVDSVYVGDPNVIIANKPNLAKMTLKAWPNPASGQLNVNLSGGKAFAYTLTDMTGRAVATKQALVGTTLLPLQGVAPGLYTLRATTADGVITKRITVR